MSVLPPLVAIIVALASRRVSFALFAGIWCGGIVFAGGDPVVGLEHSFAWMVETVTTAWNAKFLVLIALLGSGAAFVYRIGGSSAVARVLGARITTRKQAQLLPYFLGLIVFFNDYINTIVVGNSCRDICRKHKISTEKLAYLIDSTAAPVATIAPVSDWIGYQVAIVATAFAVNGILDLPPYTAFLRSIPWNFYCLLTIAAIPMIVMLGKDFGAMRQAEDRAEKTGRLVADGDTPLSSVESDLGEPYDADGAGVWHFIVPILALIAATIWGLWSSAGGDTTLGVGELLEKADVSHALLWGAFSMTFVGILLALQRGVSIAECERTLLLGFRTMLPALVIMVLAWTIAAACDALGTSKFFVTSTRDWMTPAMLPVLVFAVAALISFSTGTSWGTMAILTPIAIPIAYAIDGSGNTTLTVSIAIGATFSGAVFGDHCSPISDTTVMSSIFSGADHIAHVRTQIPYALVPAGIATVLYLLTSTIGNALLLVAGGLVAQFLIFKSLGSFTLDRKTQG